MATNEKRMHGRVHTIHLVSYTKLSTDKVPELMGMGNTVDLSEVGLKLTTREPLKEGDVIHLEFEIDGKVVKTDARVAYSQEVKHYNVGFSFEGLGGADRENIRNFLKVHGFKAKESKE